MGMDVIAGSKPFSGLNAYVKNVGKERNGPQGSSNEAPKEVLSEDMVALSPEAKRIQEAKKSLDALPDVREEKVAEVKGQVDAGTYGVSGKEIAFKMIREAVFDATF